MKIVEVLKTVALLALPFCVVIGKSLLFIFVCSINHAHM